MAKKKKLNIWPFGEKETNSSSLKQDLPLPQGDQSAKYYQSISNLPLNRYKDCLLNENLSALIISGQPTGQQLTEAWGKISQEYADAMGDHEYKLYLKLFKDVHLINATIEQVKICVTQLEVVLVLPDSIPEKAMYRDFYSKEVNGLLLTQFFFDFNNIETYRKNLQRCLNRSKGIKLELDMVMARYEAIKQKYEEGKKPDETYFDAILITLSDAAGYHLTDGITVFEFCERIKRLNDAAKRPNRPLRRPK
jgi:hypothetical protein